MDERELDQFLNRRAMPQMPTNMASRIIEASRHVSQDKPLKGIKRWLRGFAEGFIMPQPAFALGVFLLLGLTFGVFGDSLTFFPDVSTDDLSLAFEAGDYLDAEDFL